MSQGINIFAENISNQDQANEVVGRLFEIAQPEKAFGNSATQGEFTVITASEVSVSMGLGYGGGGGSGTDEEQEDADTGQGFGIGGGGGGVAMSRPIAAIEIGPQRHCRRTHYRCNQNLASFHHRLRNNGNDVCKDEKHWQLSVIGAPESIESPAITLRPANAADQQTIKQMVRGAHLNPMGLKWQRFTLAVTSGDKVIGCIQLKPHRGGVLELASLVVSREWRKIGIGRLLIDHLKDTAGPPIWLMCASPLTRFYKPFGFRQVRPGQPMPTYFRWILRSTYIVNRLSSQNFSLAIMVWEI